MKRLDGLSAVIVLALLGLTVFVWREILFGKPEEGTRMAFLDVGQGDAEILFLSGGVKMLTDAGPDRKILSSLEQVLRPDDRYVDLAIISHPQLDHFNGFNYLLDNYRFGAFIFNGRLDSAGAGEWQILTKKLESYKIPLITVSRGDNIKYGNNEIDFLSPAAPYIQSAELNDTALVELIKTPLFRTLLASDIGANIEDFLLNSGSELAADILKVPHHGSKFSSSEKFLGAVDPEVAVIEVGAGNSYGHPAEEALSRLTSAASDIFRTDKNGTIEAVPTGKTLKIFTEKQGSR